MYERNCLRFNRIGILNFSWKKHRKKRSKGHETFLSVFVSACTLEIVWRKSHNIEFRQERKQTRSKYLFNELNNWLSFSFWSATFRPRRWFTAQNQLQRENRREGWKRFSGLFCLQFLCSLIVLALEWYAWGLWMTIQVRNDDYFSYCLVIFWCSIGFLEALFLLRSSVWFLRGKVEIQIFLDDSNWWGLKDHFRIISFYVLDKSNDIKGNI